MVKIKFNQLKYKIFHFQITNVLRVKPSEFSLRVQNKSTDVKHNSSKLALNSVAKRPPPSYLKGIEPTKPQQPGKVSGGEIMLLVCIFKLYFLVRDLELQSVNTNGSNLTPSCLL